MNNSAYGIPGVKTTFLDYQAQKAAISSAGSVVVILGDMPDTYKESDGTASGYKEKPFPANSPMLVSDAAKMSDILTGANIINGVSRSNDIANVMQMLDLTKPTGFCKIVMRNGLRPNLLSLHEKYQAIENALENLANYPVSRVVVIGTAFDEGFDELPNVEYFYLTGAGSSTLRPFIKMDSFKGFGYKIKPEDGSFVSKDPIVVKGTVNANDFTITVGTKDTIIPTTTNLTNEEVSIDTGAFLIVIPQNTTAVDFETTVNPVFYNMKEVEIYNALISGENTVIADKINKELKVVIAEGDENYTANTSGTLNFEFKKDTVDATKGYVFIEDVQQNMMVSGVLTNEIVLTNGKNTEDLFIEINGLKITFKPGIEFLDTATVNGIVINYVPSGADVVYRVGDFCNEMTANLTECRSTFGVLPPKNESPKEITKQYNRLVSLSKANRGFVKAIDAENKRDLGIFIDVVVGAVKVNNIGGITNFAEADVKTVNGISLKVEKNQLFSKGDIANIYAYYRQEIFNEEVEIAGVDNNSSEDYTMLTLAKPIANAKLLNSNSLKIEVINDKDNKGTYIAALYANVVGNFGVESSYIKAVVPGSAEISYTREQMIKLISLGYTVINKSATSELPEIIDTPTMARNDSDFTDQSTRDLMFYILQQLRNVAKGYKGERFAEAAKKALFESSLKTVFEKQYGKTITAFELNVDYDLLQTTRQIFIDFSVTEAKTGKEINIQGRLM